MCNMYLCRPPSLSFVHLCLSPPFLSLFPLLLLILLSFVPLFPTFSLNPFLSPLFLSSSLSLSLSLVPLYLSPPFLSLFPLSLFILLSLIPPPSSCSHSLSHLSLSYPPSLSLFSLFHSSLSLSSVSFSLPSLTLDPSLSRSLSSCSHSLSSLS